MAETVRVDIKKLEKFLLLQYLSTSVVKGFDENRKRKDIWEAVIGDWDWDVVVRKPPKKDEFEVTEMLTLTKQVARNVFELIKATMEGSETWNGLQASSMIDLHDRLVLLVDGPKSDDSED